MGDLSQFALTVAQIRPLNEESPRTKTRTARGVSVNWGVSPVQITRTTARPSDYVVPGRRTALVLR